jgi:CBS-domain-containing membrane protein
VLGVVTEADLLLKQEHPNLELDVPLTWSRRRRLEREKAAAIVAAQLMTAPAVTVAPTATVTEAARRMHTVGVKRLPVVDDAGRLVGIVSRADLLKVYTRSDDAIWREISPARLRRGQLHLRRSDPGHRRPANPVTTASD